MAHFYSTDGTPRHQVLNKKQTKEQGKDVYRNSTIADARKNNWFSGATKIVGIGIDMSGLEAWKKKTMWEIIEREKRRGNVEPFQHYKQRVEKVLKVELEQYRILGSTVHKVIEEGLRSEKDGTDAAGYFCTGQIKSCVDQFLKWHKTNTSKVLATEQTFCSPMWGYGGCIDLQYLDKDGKFCIVDFKTKRTTPGVEIVQGLEQKRQLVAYALGIGKIECFIYKDKAFLRVEPIPLPVLGNLYLSTTEPDRWEYHTINPEEIPELILDVRDCVRLWNRENKFGPFAVHKPKK